MSRGKQRVWLLGLGPEVRRVVVCGFVLALAGCTQPLLRAAPLESVRVGPNSRGFVLHPSGQPFTPWGFNYDHDDEGRLIEDYWFQEWGRVEEDLAEMKALEANVVRVHLQFGRFMRRPEQPDEVALAQLSRLLALAERLSLYLDLTGLGCYHKQDVPAWYDALDEAGRWAAQAQFWRAVAARGCHSPAVFCYDLMNEPVVAGAPRARGDWLGPPFGDKHFVQCVTLDAAGRERWQVARQWIERMVEAIRSRDRDHLITVGLVDWSLDRPGLTSGFVPERIIDRLDFISVHIYPERRQVDRALDVLAGFAVGKPVVIEETFLLKCDGAEFTDFLERSRTHGAGWLSFYWGTSAAEYRRRGDLAAAIKAESLERFCRARPR